METRHKETRDNHEQGERCFGARSHTNAPWEVPSSVGVMDKKQECKEHGDRAEGIGSLRIRNNKRNCCHEFHEPPSEPGIQIDPRIDSKSSIRSYDDQGSDGSEKSSGVGDDQDQIIGWIIEGEGKG